MIPDVTGAAYLTAKIIILVGVAVYAVFASVIVRQEQLMAHVLEETFEPIIKLLTVIHLAAAIALFIFAFVTL